MTSWQRQMSMPPTEMVQEAADPMNNVVAWSSWLQLVNGQTERDLLRTCVVSSNRNLFLI